MTNINKTNFTEGPFEIGAHQIYTSRGKELNSQEFMEPSVLDFFVNEESKLDE